MAITHCWSLEGAERFEFQANTLTTNEGGGCIMYLDENSILRMEPCSFNVDSDEQEWWDSFSFVMRDRR